MGHRWLLVPVAVLVLGMLGCGGSKGDAAGKKGEEGGAVDPERWGERRVVCAAALRLEPAGPVPDGRQWASPPTDEACLEFTYHGPKLVRLRGLDIGGEPWHFSKLGVRREWSYAAHGGVLEDVTYEADGEATLRIRYEYDGTGRCTGKRELSYGRLTSRSTYEYGPDARTRTHTLELLDEAGSPIATEISTEYWDAEGEFWASELGDEEGAY